MSDLFSVMAGDQINPIKLKFLIKVQIEIFQQKFYLLNFNMVKRARKSSSSKSSRNSHILARYPNEKIIEMFSQMSKAMKNHGDFFRARAYNWAVATLRTIPKDLHSGSEASKYEGIGKSFAAKIDEILETGTFEEYEKEKKDPDTIAINELCSVFGIGAITAKRLLKHNIRNVEDLEQKGVHLGILNKIQQIGLKYRKDFGVPISRQEVLEFLRILTKLLEDLNEKMELVMCGGFRRFLILFLQISLTYC